MHVGFPGGSAAKNLLVTQETLVGRSPGGRSGKPLQCSCLENPVGRGAWQATVHGLAELDTTEQLNDNVYV